MESALILSSFLKKKGQKNRRHRSQAITLASEGMTCLLNEKEKQKN